MDAYDAANNRTSMVNNGTLTTYTYDANNRMLTETEGGITKVYTYDANGNQLTGDGATYTYNARGQQSGYSKDGVTASYTYLPTGLRKSKTVGITTTNYVWDGQNMVYEYNGTNTAGGAAYYYGLTLISQGNYAYYLYNAHGDVIQLVSSIGSLGLSYIYDAFGNEANPSAIDTNPFRYAGQYFDSETGTYYLRARYYNPSVGRFTQQDGWQFADPNDPLSLNLYTYCLNNPVVYCDPRGQDAIFINRHLNIPFLGNVLGIEHTAAFFQDTQHNWYYFSWESSKVAFQKVTDNTIFESFEKLNEYLANTPYEYRSDIMLDDTKKVPFITSVYIKGDFTESVKSARDIYNEYITSVAGKKEQNNPQYEFTKKNCAQVAIQLFYKGDLWNGQTGKEYIESYITEDDYIPDIIMNRLQKIFKNTALRFGSPGGIINKDGRAMARLY